MNKDAIFGAEGMISFMAALRHPSGRREDFRFPANSEWATVNFECYETKPRDFFVRLINAAVERGIGTDADAIGSCQLDEGVAVFVEVTWNDKRLLRCSVQIVAAPESNLETLFLEKDFHGVYYRFDYSAEERGQLFDHPFPHVHSVSEGAPRFHFPTNNRIFPPFAALEFAMINHCYDNWIDWLLREYAGRHPGDVPRNELTPEEFLEAYKDEAKWLEIDVDKRKQFLSRLKRSSQLTIERISERYPKIDPNHLTLNYWQDSVTVG